MSRHVFLPDFGLGNLASIVRMAERAGHTCSITRSPDDLLKADKVILAGVGAFDHGITAIDTHGWRERLSAALKRHVPFLGICLGMQMLCKSSEEGRLIGLGWVDAEVRRFCWPPPLVLRVPHMGWNTISVCRPSPILPTSQEEQRFYFAHSYHVICHNRSDVIAESSYGYPFVAAFEHENLFGVQFHPEKSHRFGLAVLKRFLEL